MSDSVDVNSLVLDAPSSNQASENAQASTSVIPPVDNTSLSLDPVSPEKALQERQARIANDPAKPPIFSPFGMLPRIAYDLGSVEYRMAQPVPVEQQKQNHIDFIANATGAPRSEVEKYYDPLKMLLNLGTFGAIQGAENIASKVPLPSAVTTKGLVDSIMTPAVVTAAVASPEVTIPSLLTFAALDHIIPTPKISGATPDQQATLDLVGMVAKGALTGGIFHGVESAINMDSIFNLDKMNMDDLLGKFTYQKLQDHGLPDVITLDPKAVDAIAQMDADNKMARKNDVRRQNAVDEIAANLMDNKEPPDNVAPEIIRDAQQQVVDQLDAKEAAGEKLKNREQQVRYDLKQELAKTPDPNTNLSKLGVDPTTAKTAQTNGLSIPIKAEKLVKVATDSPANFEQIKTIIVPIAEKTPMAMESPKTPPETPKNGLETIPGTGEVKTSGLALGVEAKAVENKLTKGFGDLPEYRAVKMDEQAKLAQELLDKDPEQARKIAMGDEMAPKGIIPEAIFVAVENKAIAEGDATTLRDLATGSKLTTEATTMGQRIATLATRDPESVTGAMEDIIKTREQAAQKRLGKTKIEDAKAEIVKDIQKELNKTRTTTKNWSDFIKSLEC